VTPLFLFAFVLAAQDKPPEQCSLSGTVVNSVTGEPLSKVELKLEDAVTTSDAKGHFAMVDLEPGSYHLIARRSGYVDTAYGARRADTLGTLLRLEKGKELTGLTVKLIPNGVISGTIRDSDGEPLEGAHVTASHRTFEYGVPRIEGYADAETDDLGQYRMRGLPPGKYYLAVQPHTDGTLKFDHTSGKAAEEVEVPTVYPGSPDPSLAMPIDVKAGARITGIDFALARTRTFTVKGRVELPATAAQATVTLRAPERGLGLERRFQASPRRANGAFELRGVPAGSYLLTATNGALAGEAQLEVAGNLEGLSVPMLPPSTFTGNLIVESGAKLPEGRFVFYFAFDVDTGLLLNFDDNEPPAPQRAPPGRYLYRPVYSPVGDWYVKSIRSGTIDVVADGLAVPPGAAVTVEILLALDGGKVAGDVVDASGNPSPGATVLLAPEPRLRGQSARFKHVSADQSGHFEIRGIAPGEYKVFAWDDVEEGIWNDPDFLKECEKNGEPVTVREKSKETVKVTQI
jgi:hypothetical protein